MNPVQHLLILTVRLYRWTLSPMKGFLFGPSAQCRFTPSCSAYALQAVQLHGAVRGGWLAAKRVCRCHPWGDCGEDPVPPCNTPLSIRSLSRSARKLAGEQLVIGIER